MNIRHVCVFCGSRKGTNPAHTYFARKLGTSLARENIGLIFGGGSVGLMNEVANAVIENGGHTHGVIPNHLKRPERTHTGVAQLEVTDTMHERKAKMSALCDAYVALPGGFGTFEELLEVITWAQLELHAKPVILANVDGYYDQLISFIDHAVEAEFVTPKNRRLLKTATTVEQCMQHLK
ncbi:MAG TPA: TIGR00730 family Rossman fold protein [Balneolaceae bacterium]|nr:TIGR00730 family Rossman fold protein [Balneolaceae bacterium]